MQLVGLVHLIHIVIVMVDLIAGILEQRQVVQMQQDALGVLAMIRDAGVTLTKTPVQLQKILGTERIVLG